MHALWIAFKILYLCMLQKLKYLRLCTLCVVNRFQNFVSLHASKTDGLAVLVAQQLWIAFKILYLCMLQKRYGKVRQRAKCCESLSKFCIFACFKNTDRRSNLRKLVVNRFQNFVSLHASKTKRQKHRSRQKLWIAFKILYLCMLQKPTSVSRR